MGFQALCDVTGFLQGSPAFHGRLRGVSETISWGRMARGLPEQSESSLPQYLSIKDDRSGRAGKSVTDEERHQVLLPRMTVAGGRSAFPFDEALLALFGRNIRPCAGVKKPLLKGFISGVCVIRVR